jgi:hypothetical protein
VMTLRDDGSQTVSVGSISQVISVRPAARHIISLS